MTRWWIPVLAATTLLAGCSTAQRGAIPVVEAGASVSEEQEGGGSSPYRAPVAVPRALPEDSGVVVMVPGAGNSTAPIQRYPASAGAAAPITPGPIVPGPGNGAPMSPGGVIAPNMPNGVPSGGTLAADEQLDGPVLALLTTAQQQQGGGDLNGASSSLERAQRIAPREPQVLYRLAEVRLAQGDAAQAEQFARRGLTYANGRPALQASLWSLIGQARERQGDPAGAAQARERARVNL
ncbi:MAG: tetratricopeptide repeat protein [Pseudomonas sp.]|uniref:tetratricopeptide repeat protein n=1 Tax=Pseudomonas sp. TaxID=306 RepID=UPI0033913D4B